MLFEPYVCFHIYSVRVNEWPPIGKKLLTRRSICFLTLFSFFSTSVLGIGFFSHCSIT